MRTFFSRVHAKRLLARVTPSRAESFPVNTHRDPQGEDWLEAAVPEPWNGEHDPDPLVFILGDGLISLREHGHVLMTGGAGSGKTVLTDALAYQALTTPMPWSPRLRGQVHRFLPFHSERWTQGREGLTETVITRHSTDTQQLRARTSSIDAEFQRRKNILASHPEAATWEELPEQVKANEQLAPVLVIFDGTEPMFLNLSEEEAAINDHLLQRAVHWAAEGCEVGFAVIATRSLDAPPEELWVPHSSDPGIFNQADAFIELVTHPQADQIPAVTRLARVTGKQQSLTTLRVPCPLLQLVEPLGHRTPQRP